MSEYGCYDESPWVPRGGALERVARSQEVIILPTRWRIVDRLDRYFSTLVGWLLARRFFTEYQRQTRAGSGIP